MLLIGAYERDNFGDLLFHQLTKSYLTEHRVVAGSIIGADMAALIGDPVLPYNDLLAARSWDAVWVVGGEIGGVDTGNALTMSLNDHDGRVFDRATPQGRAAIAQYLSDSSTTAPAYIPELGRFPLNSATPLIVNSVGLDALRISGSSTGAEAAITALRRANSLVVRDSPSREFAESNGINAAVSPDMVHAISLRYPEMGRTSESDSEPFFLFQANGYIIEKYGSEKIAFALAQVAHSTGWRPVLFLAGTARHHDRLDQYDKVLGSLRAIAPTLQPTVLQTRMPLELADWIAKSRLWIGSSLHGRIISGSFGRPRVSLENAKVSTYAATWDSEFPVNIDFDGLLDAVSAAILIAATTSSRDASLELAQSADAKTTQLVKEYL
ncbi:polysaccharide pyruvyl transferase family protein [Cryobacterium sp. PH31-O1]|uniref:polysaccharide pyruvyl transferase family protein n=1 Tax=Cryobacterium sp. PH31-O1 TaxID=3046306 RepID=UPI0024BB8ED3|nr:polysaccharide pyruvyl transferase family protein [Cryobacterium sp. PH31-O1]MDJ0337590.1 polysaccharide pyruvyl transferase family protein [Cryobacterium sp. PH31-O1]